jgi:hypothetical protein
VNSDDLQNNSPEEIAPYSFLASLPKRLLSHPNGGALAVIGKIEKIKRISSTKPGVTSVPMFVNVLKRLMNGFPVGAAMEFFNNRYGELAIDYITAIDKQSGIPTSENYLSQLETTMKDVGNVIILGDPAARLITSETNTATG